MQPHQSAVRRDLNESRINHFDFAVVVPTSTSRQAILQKARPICQESGINVTVIYLDFFDCVGALQTSFARHSYFEP